MILVLLGTQNNSFHRLLEEIDKLVEKGIIKEEILVQAGYTKYESKNMKIFDLIPSEELEKYQEQADLIRRIREIPRTSRLNNHTWRSWVNCRLNKKRKKSNCCTKIT